MHIIIMGAGITGLTSALALRKHLPDPKPQITIVEIRSTPSTIGGAVNLTPKALRYLDYLGVYSDMVSKGAGAECKTIELFDIYSGTKISEVAFHGADGSGIGKEQNKKFFARRVMRWQVQEALLDAVKAQQDTTFQWGKKVTKIEELQPGQGAYLTFEDGNEMKCDLLLGCDGIHSATRSLLVEPSREPTYTGVAVVMATSRIRPGSKLHWDITGLTSSRRGSFMASYFEPTRKNQYIAVVMEIAEMRNREGWKIRGSDQNAIKTDILDRFKCETMPELAELAEDAGEWTLYPTHKLPPKGRWTSNVGRSCILLGDAAHAMPPQGESTGLCIEDAIIFSRALMKHKEHDLQSIFAAYEKVRRPHIDEAYDSAVRRWEVVKDSGWLAYQIKNMVTPWFVWWTAKAREQEYAQDSSNIDIEV